MTTLAPSAPIVRRSGEAGALVKFLLYVRRNPTLGVGLTLLLALVLFGTLGTAFINPKKDPYPLAGPASKPPSLKYPFGTDAQGRNILAVMVMGTQYSLRIGLLAGTLGLAVGSILGFIAAYFGGWTDNIIRWVVDVMLTIPNFLVLVVIASTYKQYLTIELQALILAALAWVGPTRVVRSQVLSLRERQFVRMAPLNGMNSFDIIFREMLPNLVPFLTAAFVTAVIGAVFAALGLDLLGLGSQREPTLGMTLFWVQQRSAILRGMWWWWGAPVVMIITLIVSLTLISFGLDEWANPRTRRAA